MNNLFDNVCGTYTNHLWEKDVCARCGYNPNPRGFKSIQLNLGCGAWIRRNFINVDAYIDFNEVYKKKGVYKYAKIEKPSSHVFADISNMPFPDEYADYVEIMNTIEHFPMYQMINYVKEIYRVMKKKAKLVILTNSFTGVAIDWLRMITSNSFDPKTYYDVAEVIYGNQYGGSDGELHRCPMTQPFLNYILTNAGFNEGQMFILPRGAKLVQIGTTKPLKKNSVARNDLLIAEIIK